MSFKMHANCHIKVFVCTEKCFCMFLHEYLIACVWGIFVCMAHVSYCMCSYGYAKDVLMHPYWEIKVSVLKNVSACVIGIYTCLGVHANACVCVSYCMCICRPIGK